MPGHSLGRAHRMVLLVPLASALGCLPAGEPPQGRHIIADRSVNGAFFSSSGSDPARSYLFVGGPTRMSAPIESSGSVYATMVSDLYQVDVADTTSQGFHLEQREPTVRNLSGAASDMLWNDLPRDSRGRLLLSTIDADPASGLTMSTLNRFDPDTRLLEALVVSDAGNGAGYPTFSPGHTRALVYAPPSGEVLIELDTQQNIDAMSSTWVGEDLYYVMGTGANPWEVPRRSTLVRIRPGGAPEVILDRDGFISLQLIEGGETRLLSLRVQPPDSSTSSTYLLDPATSQLVSLPFDTSSLSVDSLSPDGRWILLRGYSDGGWAIYDRIDGQTRTLPNDLQGDWQATAEWRPGTDELWLGTQSWFGADGVQHDGVVTIWTPNGLVTTQAWPTTSCLGDFRYRSSMFNRDGSLWFSATWTDAGSHVAVGSSDRPAEPPVPIAPEGTWVNRCWELEGHRLLVEARTGDSQDADLYLFDPSSREIRALAGSSQVVQAGKERALVLLQWERWRSAGELAVIDYATGQRTHLSDDVAQAIVDSRNADILSGADPLGPGTQVVFISRNRMDSPYDGLWLTELP